jgi:cell shape-determining protein MreD
VIALLLLGLASAFAALQLSLPLAWSPLDLPLLLAAYAGLTRGNGWGLACGAVAGLWMDVLLHDAGPLRLLPLAAAGALADSLQPGVNRDQPRLQLLTVLLLVAVHDALLALLGRQLGLAQGGFQRLLLGFALPRLAAQGLLALPFFWSLGLLVKQKAFLDPRQRSVQTIRRWP